MAKPTVLPVWATDQTNNTEPSSGQKATGWTNNQKAVSSYFNWLFYTIYLWIAYLDAGVWDDDLTVTGNLTVTGKIYCTSSEQRWQTIARGTTEQNIAYDGGDFLHGTGNAIITFPCLGLTVGERVTEIHARIRGTGGTQNVIVALQRSNGDGTSTTVQSLTIANPPNAWDTYSITLSTPEVVVEGCGYYWTVNMPLNATYLATVGYTYDRPEAP